MTPKTALLLLPIIPLFFFSACKKHDEPDANSILRKYVSAPIKRSRSLSGTMDQYMKNLKEHAEEQESTSHS